MTKDFGVLPQFEQAKGTKSVSNIDTIESNSCLDFHGAMLLQTTLAKVSVNTKNATTAKRNPLSDIGNTLVCVYYYYFFVSIIFCN